MSGFQRGGVVLIVKIDPSMIHWAIGAAGTFGLAVLLGFYRAFSVGQQVGDLRNTVRSHGHLLREIKEDIRENRRLMTEHLTNKTG